MTLDNKSQLKIEPMDLMYFIELIANDTEQNASFRLEAIMILLKTSNYIKDYSLGKR